MDLPLEFTLRMKQLLGNEYAEYEESYCHPRKRGLRVNTLKIRPEELVLKVPFHLKPIPWIPEGFYYEQEDAVSRHPFYYAGLYYLQEPSAMTPASILDVEPGMKVLDLCAAPGGKATALGAKLKGRGLLVANDISASRCRALLRNTELAGISNAFVTNAPGQQLGEYFPGFFDRILLDAPCSGEGMFRKDESLIRAWDPEKPDRCAAIQRELILQAADMLRPGGRMLYSTCTFSLTENEEIIDHLLKNRPEMRLMPVPHREGFSAGLCGLEECVRLWPHRIGGEGHFLALLEKQAAEVLTVRDEKISEQVSLQNDRGKTSRVNKNRGESRSGKKGREKNRGEKNSSAGEDARQQTLLRSFFTQHRLPIECTKAEIRQTQVYANAVDPEIVRGIPFLRNGIYLGDLKKDRFEPSQSLALTSMYFQDERNEGVPEDPSLLSLPPEDPRLLAFLRGETLELSGEEALPGGWRLVAADHYPLGWGKSTGGLLKNKIPAAWRNSALSSV